jgi:hypothetical protein
MSTLVREPRTGNSADKRHYTRVDTSNTAGLDSGLEVSTAKSFPSYPTEVATSKSSKSGAWTWLDLRPQNRGLDLLERSEGMA